MHIHSNRLRCKTFCAYSKERERNRKGKRERQRERGWMVTKEKTRSLHTNYWNYVKRAATFLPQYFFVVTFVSVYAQKIGVCTWYSNSEAKSNGLKSLGCIAILLSLNFFDAIESSVVEIGKWSSMIYINGLAKSLYIIISRISNNYISLSFTLKGFSKWKLDVSYFYHS